MKFGRRRRRAKGLSAPGDGGQEPVEFTFDNWDATDRIVVATNLYEEIAVTDDPERVRAVLDLAKEQSSGWTVPPEGVPVARLYVYFYAGDRPLGSLGLGETFLTVQHFGSFWSKASEEAVRARFLALLGLEGYED
jgi:hypothetical protein